VRIQIELLESDRSSGVCQLCISTLSETTCSIGRTQSSGDKYGRLKISSWHHHEKNLENYGWRQQNAIRRESLLDGM
jgi:hypothetical protein